MVKSDYVLQNTSPPQVLLGSGHQYCSWPQIDHGIQKNECSSLEQHPAHVWLRDAYICDTKHCVNKQYPYHMSCSYKWNGSLMDLLSPSRREKVVMLTPPSPHDPYISSYADTSPPQIPSNNTSP